MDDYIAKLDAIIARNGYAVQGVMANPPLSYTVGLTDFGLPELVMIGVPIQAMQAIINDAVARMQSNGAFMAGQLQSELANFPLRIDAVHFSQILGRLYMLLGYEKRQGRNPKDLKVLQLVWPSQRGFYPDEAGYDMAPEGQPLLSLPYLEAPQGSA
jgi:hypothetical protein